MGAFLASRWRPEADSHEDSLDEDDRDRFTGFDDTDTEEVDSARQSLEQKIAQLNAALDAVSRELSDSTANGRRLAVEDSTESRAGDRAS